MTQHDTINYGLMTGSDVKAHLIPPPSKTKALIKAEPLIPPQITHFKFNWPEALESGAPVDKSWKNVEAFLQFNGVEVAYNALTYTPMIQLKGKWWPIDDTTLTRLSMAMNRAKFNPYKTFLEDAVTDLAMQKPFHPVRDYLEELTWDGVPRLDSWLQTYLGVEDTGLFRAFGRCQLMACVARVYTPGCKKDEMLVLIGVKQGEGKSSALRKLMPDESWFTDALKAGMPAKEVLELTAGCWLAEISELDGLNSKSANAVKAMLSTQVDTARMSYGRATTIRPRQFVCFGTCNDAMPLVDDTGNRRFWPVHVSEQIDFAGIERDRNQIWAEAVHRLKEGESYHLPQHLWIEAAKVQLEATLDNPWAEMLEPMLEGKQGMISTTHVYELLGLKLDKQNGYVASKVRKTMESLGWKKRRRRCGGAVTPCFANIPDEVEGKWISYKLGH